MPHAVSLRIIWFIVRAAPVYVVKIRAPSTSAPWVVLLEVISRELGPDASFLSLKHILFVSLDVMLQPCCTPGPDSL